MKKKLLGLIAIASLYSYSGCDYTKTNEKPKGYEDFLERQATSNANLEKIGELTFEKEVETLSRARVKDISHHNMVLGYYFGSQYGTTFHYEIPLVSLDTPSGNLILAIRTNETVSRNNLYEISYNKLTENSTLTLSKYKDAFLNHLKDYELVYDERMDKNIKGVVKSIKLVESKTNYQ